MQLNRLALNEYRFKRLYAQYTMRLREGGAKFQTVLYQFAADHEGVVNVGNACEGENPAALVYWVTGLCAGMAANETAFNGMKQFTSIYFCGPPPASLNSSWNRDSLYKIRVYVSVAPTCGWTGAPFPCPVASGACA